MYENILEFKGTWRSYQKRVLDSYDSYKKDDHIHIVAAPGSGKTTLGIELIRRIGNPVLVFVPTITIREQWVERIKDAFLCEGVKSEDYISQDLRHLKWINITTYQSLHSAMTNEYDFLQAVKEADIRTICLDECHHLRSEWWKALETFKKQADITFTIALTATPPYDDTLTMWNRYISMCGEIDEEITVPELVKEGSLCPHQDYVYFNYPAREEEKEIKAFKEKSQLFLTQLMNDKMFEEVIKSHACLKGAIDYDQLLEKPEYLSSILIYLHEKKLSYPSQFQKVLGFQKLEKMSVKWLQILLQGLLYEDTASYQISEQYHSYLLKELKSRGFIEKRQVILAADKALEKMLVKSVGKCDSIREIVFHEYECMGEELRLLILTDYIREEYEKAIGNEAMDVHNLGVLPFFELLRRENEARNQHLKFGVLCGTKVIIPSEAKEKLLSIIENPGVLTFKKVGSLAEEEYLEVVISGNQHFIVAAVSELFELGYLQVLIGTKSLLGEGWDSPCVNTLILASFVGSFMLSNQMRGRAIRTFKGNPNKTSHIWHLVCVDPETANTPDGLEGSPDYQTLSRRCEHFLGLHYEENVIENGMERFSAIKYPLSKTHIKQTNEKMFALSKDRTGLKKRWEQSLAIIDTVEVVEENEVEEKMITAVVLQDAIRGLILSIICTVFLSTFSRAAFSGGITSMAIFSLAMTVFAAFMGIFGRKIVLYKNPLARLRCFGDGILKALHATNQLESVNCRVKTELIGIHHIIYLSGGTGHDKTVFAKCVHDFFDPLDNQRYILYKPSRQKKSDGYFIVPENFAKRKEDAEIFAEYMRPFIGKYEAVYTRNEEGRKILLKGRMHALANRQQQCLTRKRVKGALE